MTSTPPHHSLPDPRSPEDEKQGVRLTARTLGFSLLELARAMNCDLSDLSEHPTAERLQPQLQTLDDLALQLHETFGSPEAARRWLRAPNPVLAGEAPTAYLLRGDSAAIRKLLRMAETGMPT